MNNLPSDILEIIFNNLKPPVIDYTDGWQNTRVNYDSDTELADRYKTIQINRERVVNLNALYQLTLSCKSWSEIAVEYLWIAPRIDKIPIQLAMGWIKHWNTLRYPEQKRLLFHQDCSVYQPEYPIRPYYDYAKYIKYLSLIQPTFIAKPSSENSQSCNGSLKQVIMAPSLILKWLPHCTSIQYLYLNGIGRSRLCNVSLESNQYCSANCLVEALTSPEIAKQIKYINFSGWNGKGFNDIFSQVLALKASQFNVKLHSLEYLNLSECFMISDYFGKHLAPLAPNLKKLNLNSMSFISQQFVQSFIKVNPLSITELNISFCPQIDGSIFNSIKACRNLKKLNISNLPRITELQIQENLFCGNQNCDCIGANLEYLSMVCLPVTNQAIEQMSICGSNLRVLKLTSCKLINYQSIKNLLLMRGVSEIEKNKVLSWIDLSFCDGVINDELVQDEMTINSPDAQNTLRIQQNVLMKYRDVDQIWSVQGCIISNENIKRLVKVLSSQQKDS